MKPIERIHKELAQGRWFELDLIEQLANIGMDVDRAFRWKNRGNIEYGQLAFERALDLIDLTKADPKNKRRLKEVCRAREFLIDHFMFDNQYNFTEEFWHDYFFQFNYMVAIRNGK